MSGLFILAALFTFISQPDTTTAPLLPTLAGFPPEAEYPESVSQSVTEPQQPAMIPDSEETTNPQIAQIFSDTTINSVAPNTPELPSIIVPDQTVLQFTPDTTPEEQTAYLDSVGAEIVKSIPALNTVIVKNVTAVPHSPLVLANEPDYYATSLYSFPTSDPHFSTQWNLEIIGAPAAWNALPQNASQITIAVIDSGICATHPDLVGRILPGYDYTQHDNTPQDDYGHGCAVSGIIAANVDNNIGIAGVAPNAQILPLRVLDAQGIGVYSDVAAAIVYAADNGAKIINLSLGGANRSSVLENAVNYALNKGVVIVAAAGNSGREGVYYPAAYNGVIAVGSSEPGGSRSSFSSFGAELDTLAPGSNILSTTLSGDYGIFSGTSMSAPHVSGLYALALANNETPNLAGVANSGKVAAEDTPPNSKNNLSETLQNNDIASSLGVVPINVERISISSTGIQANNHSSNPSISGDGRFVAFVSQASNLVNNDTNGKTDIFVHDRQTDITTRVSISSTGIQANNHSSNPSISGDGRFVAFVSQASNLVSNDTNYGEDIFLHDRIANTIKLVSISNTGEQGKGANSFDPSISADGRFIIFVSEADNLVSNDTNQHTDVFVRDTQLNTTTRVSVSTSGIQGNGRSYNPAISSNGRFIVFQSTASNFFTGAYNNNVDVFLHDLDNSTTTIISVPYYSNMVAGSGGLPDLSTNGRFVTFTSHNPDIVSQTQSGIANVYVRDRDTNITTLVSASNNGAKILSGENVYPSISGDGRLVVFQSTSSNLINGDTNNYVDIFLHDRDTKTTSRVSVAANGEQGFGASLSPDISTNGRFVTFISTSNNLVSSDTNDMDEIFVTELAYSTAQLILFKDVDPNTDTNTFDLYLNGALQYNEAGNGDYTQPITIGGGQQHIVSVMNGATSNLANYNSTTICYNITANVTTILALLTAGNEENAKTLIKSSPQVGSGTTSATFTPNINQVIFCLFTNTKSTPADTPQTGTTFTVNVTTDSADGVCGVTHCSLREAIIAANANADETTIMLPAGTYNLSIAGAGEDNAATGDLDIKTNILLYGDDPETTIIDANGIDRGIDLLDYDLQLHNITVRNGVVGAGQDGGGINAQYKANRPSFIALYNVSVDNNTAGRNGGGIAVYIPFTISNVTAKNNHAQDGGGFYLSGDNASYYLELFNLWAENNTALGKGGGVYLSKGRYLIYQSAITNNQALDGGGIYIDNAAQYFAYSLVFSTLSNNTALRDGGGIYNNLYDSLDIHSAFIMNTTITQNTANMYGGGIYNNAGHMHFTNTIISNNSNNLSTSPDCYGKIISHGNNLLGSLSKCELIQSQYSDNKAPNFPFFPADIVGENALLGPLQDNGGLTPTHALISGSPAIGTGATYRPLHCIYHAMMPEYIQVPREYFYADQRGARLDIRKPCDIGAYQTADDFTNTLTVTYVKKQFGIWNINNGDILPVRLDTLGIFFSLPLANPKGHSFSYDVTNIANYRVISPGSNGVFDTQNCAGFMGDDVSHLPTIAGYYASYYNIKSPVYFDLRSYISGFLQGYISDGTYRLIVCETVKSLDGKTLDGNGDGIVGDPFILDFAIHQRLTLAGIFDPNTNDSADFPLVENLPYPDPLSRLFVKTEDGNSPNNNPSHYRLYEAGSDGIFQTSSCSTSALGDDVAIPFGTGFKINNDQPLSKGYYRFIACESLPGTYRPLDGDNDGLPGGEFVQDFRVSYESAQLAPFTVNTFVDENNGICGVTHCSLREAIIAANANADETTIMLPAGTYNLSIAGAGEDNAATGDLDITQPIILFGANRDTTIINANQLDRVFDTRANGRIENLTIRGGQVTNENGGGIRSTNFSIALNNVIVTNNITTNGNGGGAAGFVDLLNSVVENNTAVSGGGLATEGPIANTTIANNTASQFGGGLFMENVLDYLPLTQNTFSGNTALDGGGAYLLNNGLIDFTFNTFSGNTAQRNGGAIFHNNTNSYGYHLVLTQSTITDNEANTGGNGSGGGVYQTSTSTKPINLYGTILYGNTDNRAAGNNPSPDCYGNATTFGNNLIGDTSGCILVPDTTRLFHDPDLIGVNPLLGALADNGGLTKTHALLPGSPAIATSSTYLPLHCLLFVEGIEKYHDQRGVPIDLTQPCDIGAYYASGTIADTPQIGRVISSYSFDNELNITNGKLLPSFTFQFTLYFTAPMVNAPGNTENNDVDNPANYRLIQPGSNGIFDTATCNSNQGDDITITNYRVNYRYDKDILTFDIDNNVTFVLLEDGTYRLLVCGTLEDVNGNALDGNGDGIGGDDYKLDFTILSRPTISYLMNIDPWIPLVDDPRYGYPKDDLKSVVLSYDGYVLDINDAAETNVANYRLYAAGTNGVFDTASCSTAAQGDDVVIAINSINIDIFTGPKIPEVHFNNGNPLPDGHYRFMACATIFEDRYGRFLDGNNDGISGDDFIQDFYVGQSTPPDTPQTGTTFTVNVTTDSADGVCGMTHCSLREAIIAANANADETTIMLPAGIYNLSIAGAGEDNAATGDLDIVSDVIISGAGIDSTVIDAVRIDRIFDVMAGANLNLSKMTLRNGKTIYAGLFVISSGGAVLGYQAGSLRINHVRFEDNWSDSHGGAIAWSESDFVQIENSTFIGNYAIGSGGAIDGSSVSINIHNSQFSENSATDGGAIGTNPVDNANMLTVIGSTFEFNTARQATGGAIRSSYGLTIENSVFNGNTAPNMHGGGIYAVGFAGSIVIKNTSVTNSSAGGRGGGIAIQNSGVLENVLLANNTALDGGGFANQYSPGSTLINVTISGNSATRHGGGIYVQESSPTFNHVTLMNNIADSDNANGGDGGGIYHEPFGEYPVFINSILYGNTNLSVGASDCVGQIGFSNYNLVGNMVTACFIADPQPAPGSILTGVDPLLAPLADNGGFVPTHALQTGSPAINAIPAGVCIVTKDARGVARPQGSSCDLGAYERDGIDIPTLTPTASPTFVPSASWVPSATNTPTASPTLAPTGSVVPTATSAASPTFVPSASWVPSATNTPTASATFVPSATHTPTALPTFSTGTPGDTPQIGATFTVNTIADSADGTCSIYHCSLREAIIAANANADETTIMLPVGTYNLSIAGAGEDNAATGDLDVFSEIVLKGAGSATTIIDAAGLDRIFHVLYPDLGKQGRFTSEDVTLTGGNLPHIGFSDIEGGAVKVHGGGTFTIRRSIVRNNLAALGGGIMCLSSNCTIEDTLFDSNIAEAYVLNDYADGGGAIWVQDSTMTIDRSTFINNQSINTANDRLALGGAINNSITTLTIRNSTFSGNRADLGSAINSSSDLVLIHNTISNNLISEYDGGQLRISSNAQRVTLVANIFYTAGSQNCKYNWDFILEGQYNLASDNSCFIFGSHTNNLIDSMPPLAVLANNGGAVPTHMLFNGVPALNMIPAGSCALLADARGVVRPQDSGCDPGAVEGSIPMPDALQSGTTYTVNTTADENDGICGVSHCSLREAIQYANTNPDENTILLSEGSYNLSIPGDGENSNFTGDLDVYSSLILKGTSAIGTIIDGNQLDRVLHIHPNFHAGTFILEDVTITGGVATDEDEWGGGGILSVGTITSTVRRSIIRDNLAFFAGGMMCYSGLCTIEDTIFQANRVERASNIYSAQGGALFIGEASAVIDRSLFIANEAVNSVNLLLTRGGAIVHSHEQITIRNSIFVNNKAEIGAAVDLALGTNMLNAMKLMNNTFVNNEGYTPAGYVLHIVFDNFMLGEKPALLNGNIFSSSNSANCNIESDFITSFYNISDDASCNFTGTGDMQDTDPLLAPLADNGGFVQTFALLPGSPALNVIPLTDCLVNVDARGVFRPQETHCEIGAYEQEVVQTDTPQTGAIFTVNTTNDDRDGKCGVTNCSLREAIIAANANADATTIILPAGTYQLSIPGANENNAATGDLDIFSQVILKGAGAANTVINANSIDRIFHVLSHGPGKLGIFTIEDVTLMNGDVSTVTNDPYSYDTGAAIYIQDNYLTLRRSIIHHNRAVYGGAVGCWLATCLIEDTLFEANTAIGNMPYYPQQGGGAIWGSNATITIHRSTFVDNVSTTSMGGAIASAHYSLAVYNSTFSNNIAGGGSAIYAGYNLTLIHNTFYNGQLWLDSPGDPPYRTFTLVGNVMDGVSGCTIITPFNQVSHYNIVTNNSCITTGSNNILSRNPTLLPLQNNGGLVPTHALIEGSLAVNAIPVADCRVLHDARNFARPQENACDMGAYEHVPFGVPTHLDFVPQSQTEIRLDWQDNANDETAYEVERSLEGDNWTIIQNALPANTVTFTDTGLTCSTSYYYRVRAFRQSDNFYSGYSNIIIGRTEFCPHVPPPSVGIISTGVTETVLKLPPPTESIIDITIVERTEEIVTGQTIGALALDDWVQIAELPPYITELDDTGLTCGTTYYYRSRTYRDEDESYSDYSPTTTVVTLPCPVPVTNTVGLYKDGVWLFRDVNATGVPDVRFVFGPRESGWVAMTGDWDGDGEDGIGLYKNGVFALRNVSSMGVSDVIFKFGAAEAGWQPIIGDWNGDGIDTIGLFKNGLFILRDSNSQGAPDYTFMYGDNTPGWIAIAGDWDASGADSVGLYRNGLFYQTNLIINPFMSRPFQFGPTQADWLPVAGDWNADNIVSIGVYQLGIWRLRNANTAGYVDFGFSFGEAAPGWQPIASYRGSAQALTMLGLGMPLTLPTDDVPLNPTPVPVTPEITPEVLPPTPEITPEILPPTPEMVIPEATWEALPPEASPTSLPPTGETTPEVTPENN